MEETTIQDAKGEESSTSVSGDKPAESSLQAALSASAASPGGEGEGLPPEEEAPAEGAVQELNKTSKEGKVEGEEEPSTTEVKDEEGEKKPEGETEDEDKGEDGEESEVEDKDKTSKEDARFDKHPRFQELRDKVKTLEPKAEAYENLTRYMAQNNIEVPQFNEAMRMVSLLNKGAAGAKEALAMLEPIYQGLKAVNGDTLPADLQKALDDGQISEPYARELARTRAANQLGQAQVEQTQRESFSQQCATAVGQWEGATRQTDAEFEQKLPFLVDAFRAWEADNKKATPAQRVAFLTNAHKQITERLTAFLPKPKPRASLPANGSSRRTKREVTSSLDAALSVARRHSED